ncbi:unnamed protein product [Ixodes hexagonus]
MSKWLTSDLEGCRVLLRTYEGDREGIVVNISSESSRITLNKVLDVDTNTPINGLLHFYGQSIKSCVVLDSSARKKSLPEREEDGPRLLRVRPVPAHLERLNASFNTREFICHLFDGDESEIITKGRVQMMGSPENLPKLRHPMATEFEVVDQADTTLDNALSAINREASIAVGFEGTQVGRNGFLSVLTVVAGMKVFIFDVLSLKDALFDKGLRKVLESKTIEKVIHGCRHLSDCFHHKFRVELDNVFDTQVADLFIYHNRLGNERNNGRLPPFVRGVQQCLRSFLHLSQDQLKYTRSRHNNQEGEVTEWHQRPLSLRQLDALVKDVVFLPELRHICYEEFASAFWRGVRYNLCLNRDLDNDELEYAPPEHIVPPGLKDAFNWNRNSLNGHSNFRGHRDQEGNGDYHGYYGYGRDGGGGFRQRPKQGFSRYTNGGQQNGYDNGMDRHSFNWGRGQFHRVQQRCPPEPNYEEAAEPEDSIMNIGLRGGFDKLSVSNGKASVHLPKTSDVVEPHRDATANNIERAEAGIAKAAHVTDNTHRAPSSNSARGSQDTPTPHPDFEPAVTKIPHVAHVSKNIEQAPSNNADWGSRDTLATHPHFGLADTRVARVAHMSDNVQRAPNGCSDWGSREMSSTAHLRFRPADMNVAKTAP